MLPWCWRLRVKCKTSNCDVGLCWRSCFGSCYTCTAAYRSYLVQVKCVWTCSQYWTAGETGHLPGGCRPLTGIHSTSLFQLQLRCLERDKKIKHTKTGEITLDDKQMFGICSLILPHAYRRDAQLDLDLTFPRSFIIWLASFFTPSPFTAPPRTPYPCGPTLQSGC